MAQPRLIITVESYGISFQSTRYKFSTTIQYVVTTVAASGILQYLQDENLTFPLSISLNGKNGRYPTYSTFEAALMKDHFNQPICDTVPFDDYLLDESDLEEKAATMQLALAGMSQEEVQSLTLLDSTSTSADEPLTY